jgi:hypothetical protein
MFDFKRLRFNFPLTTGRPQSGTLAAVFPSRVNRADAAINGFDFGFTQSDHHLFGAQVGASTAINGNPKTRRNSIAVLILLSAGLAGCA